MKKTILFPGSRGEEVRSLQEKLRNYGFETGGVDGIYGSGTEKAVRDFQASKGLEADGKAGPRTLAALFQSGGVESEPLVTRSLTKKCLALTGTFETGKLPPDCFAALAGDFDGQGISFGVLQWNFGQQTLQPLLREMNENYREIMAEVLGETYDLLINILNQDYEKQMAWARTIQNEKKSSLIDPWRACFKKLGLTQEYQDIQVKHASRLFKQAIALCGDYGLWSERGAALMFDIKVQNGSIRAKVKAEILKDFEKLDKSLTEEEVEVMRMQIIADRRAEAANPKWIEDVRSRKLCCGNGDGKVHGRTLNLESQFGLGLRRIG